MRGINKGDKVWIYDGIFLHCGIVDELVVLSETVPGYKIKGDASIYESQQVFPTLVAMKWCLIKEAVYTLYRSPIKCIKRIVRVFRFK
jgi:hypothetical protein